MKITVDISMYPLDQNYVTPIKAFIGRLREFPDIEMLTNQLSTQLTGEFASVTTALNTCMAESMAQNGRVVFVTRYLNTGLEIGRMPRLD
jgi:uncharacterized protein YqgV (UPF0045/DUF77 family)